MSAIEDIRQSLSHELERLDNLISRSLDSSNSMMNQIIDGYMSHKGKQLRPMLVMLTAKLLGGEVNEAALTAAASVEILHNASLIHDDVVDDSDCRHGHPTINAVWDNHIAVLVGDFFVSNSLALATRTEDIRVIRAIAELGKLLSLGEMDQVYNARFHELDEQAYFKVISHKTASLFVTCTSMGAYCCGVTDWRLDAIREFAELFGLCFQIKDDIFDYFDSKVIGKPTGNDLREGKVSLPLLYAVTQSPAPESEKEAMRAILSRESTLTDDEIQQLIAFAHKHGGIDYAYAVMERMRSEAMTILARFQSPVTAQFAALFDFVISRDN